MDYIIVRWTILLLLLPYKYSVPVYLFIMISFVMCTVTQHTITQEVLTLLFIFLPQLPSPNGQEWRKPEYPVLT